MLDEGFKSPIDIAQQAFGRPAVSLRMLPNVDPKFLQRGREPQGAGLPSRGFLTRGWGGDCLVSRCRHFAGGVRGGPDVCAGGGPDGRTGAQMVAQTD